MKKLQLDDFRHYTFLSDLRYSPSGCSVAVVASKANDRNGYTKVIFVDKGGGYFALTAVNGEVGMYAWLDDDVIIFSETRSNSAREKIDKGGELTSFHSISISGGEASPLFDVDAIVTAVEPMAGGAFLMTALSDNSERRPSGPDDSEKNYQVVDELPFWYNGRGFINKKRVGLYRYGAEAGLEALTDTLDDIEDYKLSPCGGYVLYTCGKLQDKAGSAMSNLYLLDIKKKESRALLEKDMMVCGFDFMNDKIVLAASYGEKYSFNEHPDFYIMGMDGEKTHICGYDRSIGTCASTDSRFDSGYTGLVYEGCYYFTSLDRFHTDIYKVDLSSAELTNVTRFNGNVSFFDIRGGCVVFVAMKGLGLQEVYELRDGEILKKSFFNDRVTAEYRLSPPVHHVVSGLGGDIDGWVIAPPDYAPGQGYPAILNIHGGPKMAYGDCFFHEMQYWAARGYFVMFCNPRGSDGKGNEFADIRGKFGMIDYDDIMIFTDEVCRLYPDIDSARLGVTGGSYGGFMTNWIVGHTNRFAAAATQRCTSNWTSFGCTSDIGYWFVKEQMQADPWTDEAKLWWHSPLKYAPNVTTPTLILHSDEDYRCWLAEAYQWFTALKLHGADVRLHIFHGENHDLSRSGRPDSRARRIKEITDWMDKYLK